MRQKHFQPFGQCRPFRGAPALALARSLAPAHDPVVAAQAPALPEIYPPDVGGHTPDEIHPHGDQQRRDHKVPEAAIPDHDVAGLQRGHTLFRSVRKRARQLAVFQFNSQ